jgi:hypothetical protein
MSVKIALTVKRTHVEIEKKTLRRMFGREIEGKIAYFVLLTKYS